jgi:hypothetical protein
VRFWVSSIRLVRCTGLLHSSMLGAILPAILPVENESNCFWIQGEQQLPFAGTSFLVKNSAAPSGSIRIQTLTCKLPLEHGLYILLSFYHPCLGPLGNSGNARSWCTPRKSVSASLLVCQTGVAPDNLCCLIDKHSPS